LPDPLTSRLALAAALASFAAAAQDRRAVVEPTFPPSCALLAAQLQIVSGEPSSEAAFDTARIQTALNACPSGQAVELTTSGANNAFLVQPLNVPSGVGLVVDGGVTVFASRNPADYQIGTPSASIEQCGTVGTKGNGCKQLLTLGNNSSLMGYGVIDARGGDKLLVNGAEASQNWWDLAAAANTGSNDQNNFVLLQSSGSPVTLYKITLRNSPMFHVVWKGSGFTAWGVKVATPYTARNTDGIDPSGTDITVTGSWLSDGDDNVAISASSASQYITVSDVHAYSGHGISIGSFTKGGLTNMLVDRVSLAGTAGESSGNGLRIKSAQDRGGLVQNVTWQNVCAKDVRHALVLDPFYDTTPGTLIPQYQNIVLRNAHFLTEGLVQVQGYDAAHPTTLTLDNVVFDQLNAGDFSPAPQYASIALGPGAVYPAALQSVSGTGVTVTGSAPAVSSGALDCTNAFPLLVGELYLSTASATNLQSLTLDAPATFKLNATLQPAMSQVSYSAWTGVAAPSQPVSFLENGVVVGSGALSANGTLASATLNNVGGGTHTYVARYPGDANYPAVTFGSVTVTVNGASQVGSSTQLDAPASAQYGQAVTLTATVTSGATGTVQFSADGASLGSAPVASGVATLAISALRLAVGTHSLAANYGGDATYSPSASSTQLLAVAAAPTTTALSLPATTVFSGAPVLLTASVTSPGGVPDGNVTFLSGATPFGTVALGNGNASMRVSAGALGQLSLSATYSGAGNYLPSSAFAQTLEVVAPFTLSAPSQATLPAQVSLTVSPQAGFTGRVDLSCATSSPAVTCTLSQPSIDLAAPVTVTVSLAGSAAAFGASLVPAAFFFLRRRRRRTWLAALALLAAGCGSTAASRPSQTVTITARSGAAVATAQITAY